MLTFFFFEERAIQIIRENLGTWRGISEMSRELFSFLKSEINAVKINVGLAQLPHPRRHALAVGVLFVSSQFYGYITRTIFFFKHFVDTSG